jgi:hypothetical protein
MGYAWRVWGGAIPLWLIPMAYTAWSVLAGLVLPRLENSLLGRLHARNVCAGRLAFFSAVSAGRLGGIARTQAAVRADRVGQLPFRLRCRLCTRYRTDDTTRWPKEPATSLMMSSAAS